MRAQWLRRLQLRAHRAVTAIGSRGNRPLRPTTMNFTMTHEFHAKERYGCRSVPVLSYLSKVNRLKRIMSLIVLALWASCVTRCEAARLAGRTALACCGEASDDCGGKPTSPDHCICSWVHSGGYISESTVVPLPHSFDVVAFIQPVDWQAPLPEARSTELIFSPPELLAGWQFTCRTAAPPRAPSFVS